MRYSCKQGEGDFLVGCGSMDMEHDVHVLAFLSLFLSI